MGVYDTLDLFYGYLAYKQNQDLNLRRKTLSSKGLICDFNFWKVFKESQREFNIHDTSYGFNVMGRRELLRFYVSLGLINDGGDKIYLKQKQRKGRILNKREMPAGELLDAVKWMDDVLNGRIKRRSVSDIRLFDFLKVKETPRENVRVHTF